MEQGNRDEGAHRDEGARSAQPVWVVVLDGSPQWQTKKTLELTATWPFVVESGTGPEYHDDDGVRFAALSVEPIDWTQRKGPVDRVNTLICFEGQQRCPVADMVARLEKLVGDLQLFAARFPRGQA